MAKQKIEIEIDLSPVEKSLRALGKALSDVGLELTKAASRVAQEEPE